jgi:hypothetical protein
MPGRGRKGTLKPDSTGLCVKCNQRKPPAGESICSTCVIYAKRGLKVPDLPNIPGQTPPPPRTPSYDKRTPQKK